MAYADDYEDFQAAGLSGTPESYQARWCACWCMGKEGDREAWIGSVLENEPAVHDRELAREGLRRMIERSTEELEDDDYAWRLLLPEEDTPITERVAALSAWCDAYILGLAQSGLRDDSPLGPEAREFLSDVQAISALEAPQSEAGEEDALFEVVEYVRLGVMVVRTDHDRHQDLH